MQGNKSRLLFVTLVTAQYIHCDEWVTRADSKVPNFISHGNKLLDF